MRRHLLTGAAALLLAAAPAAAQRTPPARPDTTARDTLAAARDTAQRLRVGPGKAFLRSLIFPGWGQASAGNYVRAGVFFALQGTSDGMLAVTLKRLSRAEDLWKRAIVDSVSALTAKGDSALMASPDSLLKTDSALWHMKNDTLVSAYALVRSRRKQREDRIFQAVFFTLVGGLDAFINAQLSDFPAGVGVEPKPGGGYNIHVDIPFPARKPHR